MMRLLDKRRITKEMLEEYKQLYGESWPNHSLMYQCYACKNVFSLPLSFVAKKLRQKKRIVYNVPKQCQSCWLDAKEKKKEQL